MTAATDTDPVRDFLAALPANARNSLHRTQLVVALVHAAVRDHGWTARLLAQECGRDLADVVNAGAVVTDRLRKAAQHPPPNQPSTATRRPLCPDCEDGWLVDETSRLPVARCPCRTAS